MSKKYLAYYKKIHGLTNSFLNKHPPFKDQVAKFLNFIKNDPLIIHNADFDIGFLNNELKLSGFNQIENKVLDTVKLARQKLNSRTANLDYLCKRFSIDLSERKMHGALLDSLLLSEVYLELLGGRQTSMLLSNKQPDAQNKNKSTKTKKHKIHEIEISLEEKKEHKEFVSQIKNPIWYKTDY